MFLRVLSVSALLPGSPHRASLRERCSIAKALAFKALQSYHRERLSVYKTLLLSLKVPGKRSATSVVPQRGSYVERCSGSRTNGLFIHSFIHISRVSSYVALPWNGENIWLPYMEPRADRRPTCNGVWPGSLKTRLHGFPRLINVVESTKVNRVNSSFQQKWSTGLTGEQVGDGQLSFNVVDSLWVTHHRLPVCVLFFYVWFYFW